MDTFLTKNRAEKLVFINIFTTLIVVLIPLLDLEKLNNYVSKLFLNGEMVNSSSSIIVGSILFDLTAIFIMYHLYRVICIYCKLAIGKNELYFLVITSKLMIALLSIFIIAFQMPNYIIFIREIIFSIVFCAMVYRYLEDNDIKNISQFKKMTFLVVMVSFILNLILFLTIFK